MTPDRSDRQARTRKGGALSGNGARDAAAPTLRVDVVHVPSPDARCRLALAIDYLLSRIAEDPHDDGPTK